MALCVNLHGSCSCDSSLPRHLNTNSLDISIIFFKKDVTKEESCGHVSKFLLALILSEGKEVCD